MSDESARPVGPGERPRVPLGVTVVVVAVVLGGVLLWLDVRALVILHTTTMEHITARQTASVSLCTEVVRQLEHRLSAQAVEVQRLLTLHEGDQQRPSNEQVPLMLAPEGEEARYGR